MLGSALLRHLLSVAGTPMAQAPAGPPPGQGALWMPPLGPMGNAPLVPSVTLHGWLQGIVDGVSVY